MRFITFEQIKAQLRLDDEQATLERELLELYGDAAEDAVLNLCGRSYEDVVQTYGSVPSAVKMATLLLVAHEYQHREPVSPTNMSVVPYSFDLLVKPYMRLASVTDGTTAP